MWRRRKLATLSLMAPERLTHLIWYRFLWTGAHLPLKKWVVVHKRLSQNWLVFRMLLNSLILKGEKSVIAQVLPKLFFGPIAMTLAFFIYFFQNLEVIG